MTWVGSSPPRPDARAKVDGTAQYVADLSVPGAWHGWTVRSPVPRGRITIIDVDPARAADGEIVVVTAADLPGPNVLQVIKDDWPVLADTRCGHLNEPLALVAAPTRERARAAAARIRVDVEAETPVLTLDDADVELASCSIDHGDVETGFALADHVIEGTFESGHHEHAYIEPQGVIAIPGDGTLEVIGSLQCPYYLHHALVHLLDGTGTKIRVRQAVTGGGFGGKEEFPDMIGAHAALLARACGRPVKLIYDRHEDIIGSTKRHPSRVRHRTGVAADGTLVAQDIEVLLDAGAYVTLTPVVLSRAVIHAAGAYRCPHVRIRGRALKTNTPPNGAFRGFGAPQSETAMERQMDRIGRQLDIDPLTLRLHNAYREGDVTPTGQVLDASVSALEVLEKAAAKSDFSAKWAYYESEYGAAFRTQWNPCNGIGIALAWHGAGFTGDGERRLAAKAAVEITTAGRVRVLVASTDFGQGTTAVLAQMVADGLGVDLDRIDVAEPDTDHVPDSGPTVASRTVMIVGGVLTRGAMKLGRKLRDAVASAAGIPPDDVVLTDDRYRSADGTDLSSFDDAARRHGPLRVEETHVTPAGKTFDETTYQGTAYPAYGWACNVVELTVDPDTLEVDLEKVTVACDVGRAIHPVLCAGQIEGGALQAVAWGYLEEVKCQDGRYLNDRLQTCIIPTARDAPDFETILVENPAPSNPHGAKGVGEIPMDVGAAATLAAIENATGLAAASIPATPERLLTLLQERDGAKEDPA